MMSPSTIGLTPSPGTTVSMWRTHHDWLRVQNRPGETCDHVAAVAADFFSGVIDLDLRAHCFAVLFNAFGNLALFAR